MNKFEINEHNGCLFVRPPHDELTEIKGSCGLRASTLFTIVAQLKAIESMVYHYKDSRDSDILDSLQAVRNAIECEALGLKSILESNRGTI